jgi:ankyrin repeat protein
MKRIALDGQALHHYYLVKVGGAHTEDDAKGRTALHLATARGFSAFRRYLVQHIHMDTSWML